MKRALEIFRFLQQALERGEKSALVTITSVVGGSSRSPGTHIAVAEHGRHCGSISGGCVEAAVVGEADRIMRSGQAEFIRFGVGSRFIDIRLPCGGGLDLLFTPAPPADLITEVIGRLTARQSVGLLLDRQGGVTLHTPGQGPAVGWQGARFLVSHQPDLRILIIGHGAETEALARLAHAYGAEVAILSPDAAIVEQARLHGYGADLLKTPRSTPFLKTDPNTAVVFLFRDHDWEADLIAQALSQEGFFIGAMGSRATHRLRLDALRDRGCDEHQLSGLVGPIGLIPATRDPDTLALSTLTQIVERYGQVRPPLIASSAMKAD